MQSHLNPYFANAGSRDFHLRELACVNAGTSVGLTGDFDGTSVPGYTRRISEPMVRLRHHHGYADCHGTTGR
jgi:hypothetical protein